jgi:hypothetical protein
MSLKNAVRAFLAIISITLISSCGSAGNGVAEFQTVSVNISKFSTGTLDSIGSDVYPGNVCAGTTQTTPGTSQTPETFSATLQSTAYKNVTNPLNVYVEGYTVTYSPAVPGAPIILPYDVTTNGLVVPSGGTAELTSWPLIDIDRKDLVKASIPPCSSTNFTYYAVVTIHMVEAQGISRVTQDLVFSTNLVLRDI